MAVFCILVLTIIFFRFPFLFDLSVMWSHYCKPLLLLIGLFILSLGIGARCWKLLRLPSHVSETLGFDKPPQAFSLSAREYVCFAWLLGLGVMGNLVFLMALLQLLKPWHIVVLSAVLILWGGKPLWSLVEFWWSRGHIGDLTPRKRHRLGNRFFFNGFLPVYILAVAVFGFIGAFQPPDQSDALRYHLAVPEVYVHQGGWTALPNMSFSNFPFNIEMLYAVALVFDAPSAARLIHYMFFLITLALIYLMTCRLLGRRPATLATAIFAGIPFLPILAGWAFIEVALVAFQLAALFAMLLSETEPEEKREGNEKERASFLRLAGAMLGISLAVKYTSVFLAFAMVVWLLAFEQRRARNWKNLLWLVGFALLLSFPWYLKNTLLFGNPVYPLLGDKFGWGQWNELNSILYQFHMRLKGGLHLLPTLSLGQKVIDFLTLPVRMTFLPRTFGGWSIGLVFLPGLVFLLFARKLPTGLKSLFAVAFFLFVVWGYTYRDNRFLLPVLVIVAVGIGIATDGLLQEKYGKSRLLAVVLGILLTINFFQFSENYVSDYLHKGFLTGRVSREEYLKSKLVQYPAYRQLGGYTDSKVLFIGEYRGLYCPVDYVASDWFDTPVIVNLLRNTPDNKTLIQRLKEDEVDLILYNEEELQKYFYPWFALHLLPEEKAISLLNSAMEQGRTLNTPAEINVLMQEVKGSRFFARFQDLVENSTDIETVWEESGVKILRLK